MMRKSGLLRLNNYIERLYSVASDAASPVMATVSAEKRRVRTAISLLNRSVEAFDVQLQSQSILQQIVESEWFKKSKRLSIYVSTAGEVSTDALIRTCLARGKEVFIPNFERGSNHMDMIRLQSWEDFCNLSVTLWGIRQHVAPPETLRWKHFGPLDVIVVPGMAFTLTGLRLGHGKGYYDRFLMQHNELYNSFPFTVGLALQHQVLDDLPVTNTDVPLDLILQH